VSILNNHRTPIPCFLSILRSQLQKPVPPSSVSQTTIPLSSPSAFLSLTIRPVVANANTPYFLIDGEAVQQVATIPKAKERDKLK
ncbi:hypothetical protein M8C21_004671, partial [Ambrosia artemisiifolia]